MCNFSEAIKLKDGELFNLEMHNRRFNMTRYDHFNIKKEEDLRNIVKIPESCQLGVYKVRIIYNQDIISVEFLQYNFKPVSSLQVVYTEHIEYSYKYSDRSLIDVLFKQRSKCDDIIIVQNGYICDASSSNLLFFDGDRFVLPKTKMLMGTRALTLIETKRAVVEPIQVVDIKRFTEVHLINAMVDVGEKVVPVRAIEIN